MRRRKGFTLLELLIVIAIIVVLVAIAIPVFSSQVEKAREARDLSNLRSAVAEVMNAGAADTKKTTNGVEYIKSTNGCNYKKYVYVVQTRDRWQSKDNVLSVKVGGVDVYVAKSGQMPTKWTVRYYPDGNGEGMRNNVLVIEREYK